VGQLRNPIKAQQIDRKITDCFDAGYTYLRVRGGDGGCDVFYFIRRRRVYYYFFFPFKRQHSNKGKRILYCVIYII